MQRDSLDHNSVNLPDINIKTIILMYQASLADLISAIRIQAMCHRDRSRNLPLGRHRIVKLKAISMYRL